MFQLDKLIIVSMYLPCTGTKNGVDFVELYNTNYFATKDNQFCFQQGLSCNRAILCVNEMIWQIVAGGDSANIAALGINKTFPGVNLDGLIIASTKRNVLSCLIKL
jgi:hypothetical protein